MMVSPALIPLLAALPETLLTTTPPPAALDWASLSPRGLSMSTLISPWARALRRAPR
jgi:hypothetical protein